ncbi:MAG: chromate efflux transporter [Actinomycetota bacterium]
MATHLVPFKSAFRYWLRLGFINFGGPAGQIAIMQDELVEKKRWISNNRFLHALNYCMLLPGPEAQQLAIYIGWLLNGVWGGIVAGVLFVAPAFFLIMGLSWTYAVHGDVDWVAAIFYGLRAAVIALVFAALIRIASRTLKSRAMLLIATLAFVAIFLVKVPFPLIVASAALVGLIGSRVSPGAFPRVVENPRETEGSAALISDEEDRRARPRRGRGPKVLVLGLAVWWVPLLVVYALRGGDDTLSKEALFFSQVAMVTFGGAYAALSYVNQAAVQHFGWLEPGQMITGLGLAESTPGPLIMVTQFVGFLAAYRFPGELDPVAAGVLGATVTVWAIFAPCFLWIFLGAPHIERLRGNRSLNTALASVTAAVVGVILNLAVTFAIAALFGVVQTGAVLGLTFPRPVFGTVDVFAIGVALVAFVILARGRVNFLWVILGSAVAGFVYRSVI